MTNIYNHDADVFRVWALDTWSYEHAMSSRDFKLIFLSRRARYIETITTAIVPMADNHGANELINSHVSLLKIITSFYIAIIAVLT